LTAYLANERLRFCWLNLIGDCLRRTRKLGERINDTSRCRRNNWYEAEVSHAMATGMVSVNLASKRRAPGRSHEASYDERIKKSG
jgi:hypothetical protein